MLIVPWVRSTLDIEPECAFSYLNTYVCTTGRLRVHETCKSTSPMHDTCLKKRVWRPSMRNPISRRPFPVLQDPHRLLVRSVGMDTHQSWTASNIGFSRAAACVGPRT